MAALARKSSPRKRNTRKAVRRPKRSTLKNKCDAAFSRFIRSVGYCQAAGLDQFQCGGPLQCAHIEGRRNHRLRWEELGAISLCAGHHRYYTDHGFAWFMFISAHFPEHAQFVDEHINEFWDKDYDKILERWKEWM